MLFVYNHMIQNLCEFLFICGIVMLHTFHISIVETSIQIFPVGFINRFHLSEITAAITTIAAITRESTKLIHRGDSTHTHDQVMLPVSFRPINNTVRRPGKPIPLEEEEFLLDMRRRMRRDMIIYC
jgi:hypothetical protein